MLAKRYTTPQIRLFNSLFDDLFEFPITNSIAKRPIHDIIENDGEYQIDLQLAGVKKDEIKIDVEKNVLNIKAERKEENNLNYNYRETYFGKYERSFVLPDNVNIENINASMSDGILKLIIPKLKDNLKLSKKVIEIT